MKRALHFFLSAHGCHPQLASTCCPSVLLNPLRFHPTQSPPDLPLTTRERSLGEKVHSEPLTPACHHRGLSLGTFSPQHQPIPTIYTPLPGNFDLFPGRRGRWCHSLTSSTHSGPLPSLPPDSCGFSKRGHQNGLQPSHRQERFKAGTPQGPKELQAAVPLGGVSIGYQDLTGFPRGREEERKSGPREQALQVRQARTPVTPRTDLSRAGSTAWVGGGEQQERGPFRRLEAEFSSLLSHSPGVC